MCARVLIWFIRLYQRTLSRVLPRTCRFTPTCSEYTVRALTIHGFWRGLAMGCRRVCRCHPFNPGGYDPVVTQTAERRDTADAEAVSDDDAPEPMEKSSDSDSHIS